MIVSFKDKATEDIFNGKSSRVARKACPQAIWKVASRKLDQIDSVETLDELKVPPGNRKGQYSIRINNQFRICFQWGKSGPDKVEITDYH